MSIRYDYLSVKKSSIHGVGIFANRDFVIGEEILKLIGNPRIIIYLNHSCIPNAFLSQPDENDMQSHILYAKEMHEGEEVTVDYRTLKLHIDLWEKTIAGKCMCSACNRNTKK